MIDSFGKTFHSTLSRPDERVGRKNKPIIDEAEGVRSLQFCGETVQSAMRLSDPFELELSYTRAMMGFLLFNERPRSILLVGLGGGSLSKYCHRRFPQARVITLEIDREVIALRDDFLVPPDDERFQVIHTDAAAYLGKSDIRADIILLDGFDAGGLPESLTSKSFYSDCARALGARGVLIVNFFGKKGKLSVYMNRLRGVFNDRVWSGKAFESPNIIAFALKGKRPFPTWPTLTTKAERLEERYRLNLPWLVKNMRRRAAENR